MTGPGTFAFVTFGCKVNQYESQGLREALEGKGYVEVPPSQPADVYVLNTCTVTEAAAKEAERLVRRLHRRNPACAIAVTGCAADSHREVFLGMPGVRSVVSHRDKHRLPDLLQSAPPPGEEAGLRARSKERDRDIFRMTIARFDGHSRAFVKVEDGCDLCCSFCIIPKVRGGPVSRPIAEVVEEVRRLLRSGYREFVLTGVHLGAYGKDLEGRSLLAPLVRTLLDEPLGRLRLSSLECNEIDDALIDLMARDPRRFCPHLHLPLQSGDPAILRAMRRRYNPDQFLAACDRVAARVSEPSFTTDVIVGFPGETEEQVERSLDLCRRVGMSRIHIFPYSPRSGTDAARLPDDVPWVEKKRRLRRLERAAVELTRRYALRFVGRDVDVLCEREGGYTERYLRARVAGRPGDLVRARVREVREGVLQCEPTP